MLGHNRGKGPSWGHLGPSWGHLGAILGHLGAILGHLGAIFGPSSGHLGPPWGPCWEVLGTKSDAPAEAKRSFSYLQALLVHLGRVRATTLSTLSALPVPMLGQVYVMIHAFIKLITNCSKTEIAWSAKYYVKSL